MNYLKVLSATVLALVAATAFAASALATQATSPKGTVYTGELRGTSEAGHLVLETAIANIECEGTMAGIITAHGAGITGKGNSTEWSYSNCTNGWTIDSITTGTVEIHAIGEGMGTITSTGTKGSGTRFGVQCIYETNNTELGVITDSSRTGGKATLHLEATIPRVGGSFLCGGSAAKAYGNAILNTPESVFID